MILFILCLRSSAISVEAKSQQFGVNRQQFCVDFRPSSNAPTLNRFVFSQFLMEVIKLFKHKFIPWSSSFCLRSSAANVIKTSCNSDGSVQVSYTCIMTCSVIPTMLPIFLFVCLFVCLFQKKHRLGNQAKCCTRTMCPCADLFIEVIRFLWEPYP